MQRILVIDNYDSFTYNLVHMVGAIMGVRPEVVRNDCLEENEIMKFDAILISPGPGLPDEAGSLKSIIAKFASEKKMLGVCLGHQAIAEVFGAELKNLESVYHGKATPIEVLEEHTLFESLETKPIVGRYHSWVVDKETVPGNLSVLAVDEKGEIMAICHKEYDVAGVQAV